MKYDVIIIGAGPSGIFCAYELIRSNPDMKILMIEKGRAIENRSCPKRTTKKCVGCKPCSITTGICQGPEHFLTENYLFRRMWAEICRRFSAMIGQLNY